MKNLHIEDVEDTFNYYKQKNLKIQFSFMQSNVMKSLGY